MLALRTMAGTRTVEAAIRNFTLCLVRCLLSQTGSTLARTYLSPTGIEPSFLLKYFMRSLLGGFRALHPENID